MKKNSILCASIVAAVWLSTPAFSAVDFTLGTTSGGNVPSNTDPLPWGNTRVFSSNGVSATASAWAGTGSSNTTALNSQTIQSAYLAVYGGGLGVTNRDGSTSNGGSGADANEALGSSPEHAMDNDGRYEAVLFNFTTDQVALNSLRLGWPSATSSYDSDVFVLAWRGTGAPIMGSGASASFKSIADDAANNPASGWDIVKVALDAPTGTPGTPVTFNDSGTIIYSSYWLIGAGAFSASTGVTYTGAKDYFKLASIGGVTANGGTVPPAGIPEPGSLALAGIALLGMMGVRRRKTAA